MANFILRALSALVLIPLVVFIFYIGRPFTDVMIGLLTIGLVYEWVNIAHSSPLLLFFRVLIYGGVSFKIATFFSISPIWLIVLFIPFSVLFEQIALKKFPFFGQVPSHPSIFVLGLMYILAGCAAFWENCVHLPLYTIYIVLSLVWLVDISAYIAGSLVKGPKLAPSISPNKTWSGFIGALISSLVVIFLWSFCLKKDYTISHYVLALTMSLVAQMGDLAQSYLKRLFSVKDSGNLIPGHGGLFDRLDSTLAVSIYLFIISSYTDVKLF